MALPVSAHSGRTDSSGGHHNNKTGGYHYHCGGHPAHQHTNGVCPYKNSTSSSSSSSASSGYSTSSSSSYSYSASTSKPSKYWVSDMYWDGKKFVTGWQIIDGKSYCFDNWGFLRRDEWVSDGQNIYYINSNGIMTVGWKVINGKTYFFSSEGYLRKGLRSIDNNTFYFDINGVMQTGFVKINDNTYYFNSKGVMQKGWTTVNGNTYYFDSNGVMLKGRVNINGTSYDFGTNGILKPNNTSQNTSQGKNGNKVLTWNMSQEQVVENENLSTYRKYKHSIVAYASKPCRIYLFNKNDKLYACGYAMDYSQEQYESFMATLENNGWENYLSDIDNDFYWYEKNGRKCVVFYMDNCAFQLYFTDSYVEYLEKNLLDVIYDISKLNFE